MKVSLFTELKILNNFNLDHVIHNYIYKVDQFLTFFLNFSKNNLNNQFTFPHSNPQLYVELKKLVVVSVLVLAKLTNSPIFMLQAEFFLTNEKLSSMTILEFFYQTVIKKISSTYINVYKLDFSLNQSITNKFCQIESDLRLEYDYAAMVKL